MLVGVEGGGGGLYLEFFSNSDVLCVSEIGIALTVSFVLYDILIHISGAVRFVSLPLYTRFHCFFLFSFFLN